MSVTYDQEHQDIDMTGKVYIKITCRIKHRYKLYRGISMLDFDLEGPFNIIEKVGQLAYKIDLPEHIFIYSVISVAHLKPASQNDYNQQPSLSEPIINNREKEFVVERLEGKELRTAKGKRHPETHYLVK